MNAERHTFRSSVLESVVQGAIEFLLRTPVHLLPPPESFKGVGVYSIYYHGPFELYQPLAEKNKADSKIPIYVGKAVPPGWRAARASNAKTNVALYHRLSEHSRSIGQSENLEVADFSCRFVILGGVESDIISAVEAQLIRQFTPLWNAVVDGFGNHDPGKGRYNQACSEWDVLHPGRIWVSRVLGKKPSMRLIKQKIKDAM